MRQRFIGAIITVAWVASATALATAAGPDAPRELYTRALAQERQVRDEATHPTLAQMRRVIALYESLVRKHPSSGYCDNALWQAGNVAALAYQHFGDEADKKTATRLLTQLQSAYPSSKLIAKIPDALTALTSTAAPPVAIPALASAVDERPLPTPAPPAAPAAVQKPRPDPTAPAAITLLRDVKRSVLPDGIRLTVELDGEVAYHQEEIVNPRRLFFDLKNVKTVPPLQDASLKFNDDVVKEVRLGRHPQNTTRVVVDLEGIAGYTVYPLYGPYRLVIDLRRSGVAAVAIPAAVATSGPPAAPAKAIAAVFAPPPMAPPKAEPPPMPTATVAKATVPAPLPLPSKPAAPSSLPPVANLNGKFSLSRQLGLGVSRVVIDAGHGGHDPGAHGNGINEAELTLDVALRLQALLEKTGVDVVMTRDTDVFIPLEERTAIANREGADLFLSIHANASRNAAAHGIETYFLNFATNPEAEAVAARENATSAQPMHSLPDIVKAIALNNKINESRELAATVQKSMVKRLETKNKTLRDLGVKQAPFVVLIGASMPSVLAEISFVTSKQDATQLKTNAYKQQIAQALMDAIQNYQQSLKRLNGISAKKATNQ
jgi:N-acetylmuramoyl-L-alanine amidase